MTEASRPFPKEDINFRVGSSRGQYWTVLSYLDARMVVSRLTEMDPHWSDKHDDIVVKEISPRKKDGEEIPRWHTFVACSITANGATRSDVGEAVGDAHDEKLVKTAYSDALKRAAVHFGIGAYLYDLDMGIVPKSDVEYGRISDKALEKLRDRYEKLVFTAAVQEEKAADVVPPAKKLTAAQVRTLAELSELAGKTKEKTVPWLKEQSRDRYEYLLKRVIGSYCAATDTDDALRQRMVADPVKASKAILDGGIPAIELVFGEVSND